MEREKNPTSSGDSSNAENEMTKFEQQIRAYREAQKKAMGEKALKYSVEENKKSEKKEKPESKKEPEEKKELAVVEKPQISEKPQTSGGVSQDTIPIPKIDPEIIDVDPSEIRPLRGAESSSDDENMDLETALVREVKEQMAREHEEQLAKETERVMAEDDLAAKRARLAELKRMRAEMEAEHPEFLEKESQKGPQKEYQNDNPLVAINADFTHDKKEIAHDLAGQALNKELDETKGIKGIAKRIWKGTLFKEYYTEKYKNEIMAGKRTDEQGRTISEIIREQKDVVMDRFAHGILENDRRYVHEKAGEKLIPADEKTNEEVKKAIMDYAHRKVDLGENIEDLNREFKDNMTRIMQEAIDEKRIEKGAKYTNYLATAKEAAKRYQDLMIQGREKIEHDAAMAQVMAGFQVYNAEVRNGVRTEAHRNNIDKIVDKLGKSALGNIVSSEVLYGAVGTAFALTQTGARAILGAAGGIIASSAISGLKERNRITEDRVRMMRDIANGMDYGSDNAKTAKYEKNIGGTLYDMQRAGDLTSNLKNAMESEDKKALLRAIAEARVRIDYSDSEQKDLISYSSADKRGKERLDLDIALIKAEKSLSKEDKETLKCIKNVIRDEIIEGYLDENGEYHTGVDEKDEDFKKMRAFAAMKKAGKTLAIGTAVFFGSQEIMAAIDPSKIGIFEKAGLLKTENATDAKETLLASGFGKFKGSYDITKYHTDTVETSDPTEIKRCEVAGYDKTEIEAGWTETNSTMTEVDPSASTAKINVKYDGWAGNGTKFADGNEIRGHFVDGKFISNMHGSSTYDGGATIDYDTSNIKAFLTIGDSKFEIAGSVNEAGQLTWGEGGVFTTTTGETIKAIGDNGERLYKYFEIAADQGVDGNGIQHIIPLATDVGTNTFSGKITQVAEEIIEHPATYAFTKSIPTTETFIREVTTNGIAIAPPDLLRNHLGTASAPEVASEPETPPEPTQEAVSESPEFQPPATVEQGEVTSPEAASEQPEETFQPPVPREISPESESWNERMWNEVFDHRDILRSNDGTDGTYVIINPDPISDASQERWRNWWSGLSDEGKEFVKDFVNQINSSEHKKDLLWGNGFRTWLAAQE